MAKKGMKIPQAPRVEEVTGKEKIPVSTAEGKPGHVDLQQIVDKAVRTGGHDIPNSPGDKQILYTTWDNKQLELRGSGQTTGSWNESYSGATKDVVSHEFYPEKGYGIITLSGTTVTEGLLCNYPTLKSVRVSGSLKILGKYSLSCNANLREVILEDGIESIGSSIDTSGVFYNNPSLTSIIIPDSVTTIGYMSFYECTNLSHCKLPVNSKFTTVGGHAFNGCRSLSQIYFPANVTILESFAFANSGLISVELHNGFTTLKTRAFGGCLNLVHINTMNYDGWKSTITTIGDQCFQGCRNLRRLIVPSTLKGTVYPAIWADCNNLEDLIIEYTGTFSSALVTNHNVTRPRYIDTKNKSITYFPNTDRLETLVLRYTGGVIKDVDTIVLRRFVEEDGNESGIMPLANGSTSDNVGTYIGTPNNFLKIFVPNSLLQAYKDTYPKLKDYFHPITGTDTYVFRDEFEAYVKGLDKVVAASGDRKSVV